MSNITTYNSNQQPPMALAGLWGWFRKAVKRVVELVAPFMPPAVGQIAIMLTNMDGSPIQRLGDLPLSAQEEATLDAWIDNDFLPTYTKYLKLVNTLTEGADTQKFIDVFNRAYEFIGYLNYYVEAGINLAHPGYNENMVLSRIEFVNHQAGMLEESLKHFILNNDINLSPNKVDVTGGRAMYEALQLPLPTTFIYPTLRIGLSDVQELDIKGEQQNQPMVKYALIGLGALLIYNLSKNPKTISR